MKPRLTRIAVVCTLFIPGIIRAQELHQPPDLVDFVLSDPAASLVVADNFEVAQSSTFRRFTVWGVYDADPPATDLFQVLIHQDGGGLPGSLWFSGTATLATREETGRLVGPTLRPEFFYALDLPETINLIPGLYWIQLYNETSNGGLWGWETAPQDLIFGLAGHAVAPEVPGVNWSFMGAPDFAIDFGPLVFEDGFESGDTSAWSVTVD